MSDHDSLNRQQFEFMMADRLDIEDAIIRSERERDEGILTADRFKALGVMGLAGAGYLAVGGEHPDPYMTTAMLALAGGGIVSLVGGFVGDIIERVHHRREVNNILSGNFPNWHS